jgi:hypothetical protein
MVNPPLVPESVADNGDPGSPVNARLTLPVSAVLMAAVGVNTTVTVQGFPAAMVPTQVFEEALKSLAFTPVNVVPVIVIGPLLMLVQVQPCPVLGIVLATVPNASDDGVQLTTPDVVPPVSVVTLIAGSEYVTAPPLKLTGDCATRFCVAEVT